MVIMSHFHIPMYWIYFKLITQFICFYFVIYLSKLNSFSSSFLLRERKVFEKEEKDKEKTKSISFQFVKEKSNLFSFLFFNNRLSQTSFLFKLPQQNNQNDELLPFSIFSVVIYSRHFRPFYQYSSQFSLSVFFFRPI